MEVRDGKIKKVGRKRGILNEDYLPKHKGSKGMIK